MKSGIILGVAAMALAAAPVYLFIKSAEPDVEFAPAPKVVGTATKLKVIGMDVPLAADHFGHIGVNSCIRLGKALKNTISPGSRI